jgi:hypothetical protein
VAGFLKNQKEILVFPSQSWSYPNIVIAYNNHPKKKRRRKKKKRPYIYTR